MKTNELTGAALDWAVAQANGDTDLDWFVYEGEFYFGAGPLDPAPVAFMPSRNWFDGGPIIEREGMRLEFHGDTWEAMMWWDDENGRGDIVRFGLTPLIAAMRCYVASVMGDEVDVPAELMETA